MKNINTTYNRLWWVISLLLIIFHCSFSPVSAQQYMGLNGMIHVPTAEMDSTGMLHIGVHYVDKHMIPDKLVLRPEGTKFNSLTNYLTLTPYRWIQVGYGYTLWKYHYNKQPGAKTGFYAKDRYLSARINVLYETDYLPAIVIGGNDVWGSNDDGMSYSNFYRNYFAAATKHFHLQPGTLAAHLAYRKWKRDYNDKWNGIVGGLTFQPAFYQPLRLIGEYDGEGINVGADCLIYKYFQLQLSLQQGKYVSGGLSLCLPLLK